MQLNALSSRAILRRCKPVAPLARKNEALISAMSCKSRPVDSCQRQPGLCDENDDQPRFLRSLINEAPAAQARATRHASQPTEPFFRCALSTPLGWLWAASEYGRAGQGRAGQGRRSCGSKIRQLAFDMRRTAQQQHSTNERAPSAPFQ